MSKNNASRRRAEKRQRRAKKRRAKPASPPRTGGQLMLLTTRTGPGPIDHDNCPCCVAMRELGIEDGQPISAKQHAAYEKRVDELNMQMGEPILARMTGEEMMRKYDWVDARLREEGRDTEMERMSDQELERHLERVQQLMQAYDALN